MTLLDQVRQYWDANPCNSHHSEATVGSRDYFDQVEAKRYFVEPHLPRFADFAAWKGKAVLELGCGIGTDMINFARAGATVTAVDISEVSLALAKQRAAVYGVEDRIYFILANAEELANSLLPQSFDLIYASGSIHHSPHPEVLVEQLRAFTKPGTVLKLVVYHTYAWKVLWLLLTYGRGRFWGLDKLIATHSEAQTGCPVTHTYTPNSIRTLLAPYFTVQQVEVAHIFPYQIEPYIHHQYVREWYWRMVPAPIFDWLQHHFGWHLLVTAVA
jgi:SAM-dependent methyltransferase